jgi:hypothetical protein
MLPEQHLLPHLGLLLQVGRHLLLPLELRLLLLYKYIIYN